VHAIHCRLDLLYIELYRYTYILISIFSSRRND